MRFDQLTAQAPFAAALTVMAGLVPAIHVLLSLGAKDVDTRDKPGHDDWRAHRSINPTGPDRMAALNVGELSVAVVTEDTRMMPHRWLTIASPATILVAMLSLAAPARAQTFDPKYPVCLQVFQSFKDYYFDCTYATMAQCQASGSGRSASCLVNPYYAGPKARRSKKSTAY